jgi:hypothetical protein
MGTTLSFFKWASAELAGQNSPLGRRLGPALSGLELAASGKTFDRESPGTHSDARRFLGWTAGQHWLLGPDSSEASRSL